MNLPRIKVQQQRSAVHSKPTFYRHVFRLIEFCYPPIKGQSAHLLTWDPSSCILTALQFSKSLWKTGPNPGSSGFRRAFRGRTEPTTLGLDALASKLRASNFRETTFRRIRPQHQAPMMADGQQMQGMFAQASR